MERKEGLLKIKEVLDDIFGEEFVELYEEDGSSLIFYPTGSIRWEEDKFMLSHDYSFILNHQDIRMSSLIVKLIMDLGIDLIIMEGYWTVVDEDYVVVNTIWEHDVYVFMKIDNLEFNEALQLLIDITIEKSNKKLN